MSRLPVPFRKQQTPLERAVDLGAKGLKLYLASRVAKKGAKLPLIGVGLAGAAFVAKKLRGGSSAPAPQAYAPPPSPSIPATPTPDKGVREAPHGDIAADLLKGGDRQASAARRDVGTSAPPAGTGGQADGADVAEREITPPSEAKGDADASTSGAPAPQTS